ncbi:DUF58 domain-containing protein [Halobellus inordinatus]|uniref:DUF58 domain-containing protein n=1 Tax=Halobellus inordinatus TaxID=1126236 RepID=UPI00210DBB50|nr:DUF58 domain-containing protein [Halobellus inordinatus]
MRPTRRGYTVGIVVLGALALGALFGARALDAVVIPGALALVAAVVQVWRAPTPQVERTLPPADVPGVTGTVEVTLDAPSSYPATVRDRLPPSIDSGASGGAQAASSGDAGSASTATHEAVVAGATDADVAYEITPQRRGEHELGPVSVVVTDVLGLLKRTTTVDERDGLVVFPAVGVLSEGAQADLRTLTQSPRANRREEFDDLREYVRGDALRDVHWKSSAKRGNLMVREFTAEADPDQVRVVAGIESGGGADTERTAASKSTTAAGEAADAADDAADIMAEAAATVCLSLLRGGASVALTTPSGRVEATPGTTRPLLDHLAVAGAGPVPTREADVVVVADEGSASIRFDGREHRFEELTTGAGDTAAPTAQEATG